MEFESKIRVFIINIVLVFIVVTSIYFTGLFHDNFLKEVFSFNFEHGFTFFIFFIIELSIIGTLLYKFFSNRKNKLADSNLLSYKDINREQRVAKNSVFYPKNNKFFEKDKSAMYISRNVQITTKKSHEHILLLGPTGSGKSASFFLPNLLSLDNVSIVTTDPKGELYRKSGPELERKGYKLIHLNFNNAKRSAHYNLLGNAKHYDDIRKISESILGADEWGKLSKTLLEAYLYHEYDRGQKDISRVVDEMARASTDIEEMEKFFQNSSEAAFMSFLQFKKTAKGDGFVSSVFATIQAKMKVFEFETVRSIGSQNDFTPSLLRNQKVALFVSYPEDESTVYAPFLASFYYQLFNQIKTDPSVDEAFGRPTGLPVYFLLDEFANIGRVPEIDVLLSTVRSKKMSLVLGIQSFGQLKKNYKDTFDIIVENCKTKVILGGTTGTTAEFFSKLVGEEEYTNMSVSQSEKSLSTSTSTNKKSILSSDQIRRLKSYQLVCVSDNLKPFRDDKNYYFLDKFSYILFKKLPFSVERNDEIIRKYTSWKEKKQSKGVVQEKKIHIQQQRQERNEEKISVRQERVLSKQDEIRQLREQRRKRDFE